MNGTLTNTPEVSLIIHHNTVLGKMSVCVVQVKPGESALKIDIPLRDGKTIYLFDLRPQSIKAAQEWLERKDDKRTAEVLISTINSNKVAITAGDTKSGREVILRPSGSNCDSFRLSIVNSK